MRIQSTGWSLESSLIKKSMAIRNSLKSEILKFFLNSKNLKISISISFAPQSPMQSTSISNLNLNGFLPRGARRSPEPESPSPRVPPTTSSFPQCQCFSRGFRCRPGARSVLSVDSSRSVVLRVGQDRQTQRDGNRRRLFHGRFPRAHFHIAHRTRT